MPSWGAYINGVSQALTEDRTASPLSNHSDGPHVYKGWTGQMDKLIFNEENARIVGQYIGERYPGLPKILGGDTNRFWASLR